MLDIYDNSFNANEWLSIILLLIGFTIAFLLKKRFTTKEMILYMLYGLYFGILADHTISIPPFDFYDVNDKNLYQLMDFISYVMYAPYSYILIYILDYFKIRYKYIPIYILGTSLFSILLEFFAHLLGVYHYKNGYVIYYSFPIYLLVFTLLIYMYIFIQSRKDIS